ncbi:hypothetical protein DL96DRAFT_1617775 [Flagelloscypha sp. PMI_526]|nr:hypothetical protein DL96DRAFT_1617775 [Flagelloscypha sp. PMI_526]
MPTSIRTVKSGPSSSRSKRNLPPELWQKVANYLSSRELQNAAFLHPALSQLAKSFKYREARIELSFSGRSGHGLVSRDSLKSLARLRSTRNAHRIQTLHIGSCHVSSATPWILKFFGERVSDRLVLLSLWQPNPNILHDFVDIKVLHIEASFFGSRHIARSDSSLVPRHPFMSWIWEHLGAQLTALSVVLAPNVHNLFSVFPDKIDLSGLLPALQAMEVTLIFVFLGDPANAASQRLKVIDYIATLYVRLTSLKCLTINGYEFVRPILTTLLPLHADALPSLENLTLRITAAYSTSIWADLVGQFIALHSEKLKVLRLSGPLIYRPGQNTTRWLSNIPLPAIVTLELHNLVGFLTTSEIADFLRPPALIARSLKCLTINLALDRFSTALPNISAAAPLLDSLHIKGFTILSTSSVVLLARHFPNLHSLCLEFTGFPMTPVGSEAGTFSENTPDSFIMDFRSSKEDDLLNWKLFDISLLWTPLEGRKYHDSWHFDLLKAFATRVPSLVSFHGEGDKCRILKSPPICPCSFRTS